jgi:hypothetical protein
MTARDVAKLIAAKPRMLASAGKEAFVVMPLVEYQKLVVAIEDAMDLLALEEARRENEGKPLIPWSEVRRQIGAGKSKRTKRRKKAA